MDQIAAIRKDYKLRSLDEKSIDPDPFKQFEIWWEELIRSNIDEVNAMTLATADKNGKPAARIVLLKGFTKDGFVFFTNYESHKGATLKENPQACLVFFWKELERQVRIEGLVEKVTAAESDEYFHSRPVGSKIGAWASPQSTIIASREILEEKVTLLEKKFSGKEIERPGHWGGYILKPNLLEFWQGRPSRLHDRLQYSLIEHNNWKVERLAP
ncbi:pyridoxamine 5'-phosphate oxidase [soil metagenome]